MLPDRQGLSTVAQLVLDWWDIDEVTPDRPRHMAETQAWPSAYVALVGHRVPPCGQAHRLAKPLVTATALHPLRLSAVNRGERALHQRS